MSSLPTLEKQPSESRVYEMKFNAKLAATEIITSVVNITASPSEVGHELVFSGSPTITSKSVTQRIEGGDAGISYKITIVVETSDGNTLEGDGRLNVLNR